MPSLIRLFIVLLVLAGLAFGGMVALTILVDPGEKDITIKIPARDLVTNPNPDDPLSIKAAPLKITPGAPSPPAGPPPGVTAAPAPDPDKAAADAIVIEPGTPE